MNLINNAVKYTKEGQIDIKVSKNAEETKLIFEVKDTGIGIKERCTISYSSDRFNC